MSDVNPLPELKNNCLTGAYDLILQAVRYEQREKYQEPGIMEDTLCFDFDVLEEGIIITRYATLKTGKKSNLYALLSSMAPLTFTTDVFSDRTTLWHFLQSLIGKTYIGMCQPNENMTYTKIVAISPKGAKKPSVKEPLPMLPKQTPLDKMAKLQPNLDDDDLPY